MAAEELGYSSSGRPAPRRWPRRHAPVTVAAARRDRRTDVDDPAGVPPWSPRRWRTAALAEDARRRHAVRRTHRARLRSRADAAASAAFGRDHDHRLRTGAAAVDRVVAELDGSWLVPAAPGLRGRLWQATGPRRCGTPPRPGGSACSPDDRRICPAPPPNWHLYWYRTVGETAGRPSAGSWPPTRRRPPSSDAGRRTRRGTGRPNSWCRPAGRDTVRDALRTLRRSPLVLVRAGEPGCRWEPAGARGATR